MFQNVILKELCFAQYAALNMSITQSCHKCCKEATRTVPNVSTIDVLSGTVATTSGRSNENRTTSDKTGSSRLSFTAYRMRKEQERLSCSPKGPVGKKLKKAVSNNNRCTGKS